LESRLILKRFAVNTNRQLNNQSLQLIENR
jgi:hypothetical protein